MPHQKFSIPTSRPDDEPTVCIPVNVDWVGWLLGIIYPHRYHTVWSGNLEENRQARQDVIRLLEIIMQARDCNMAQDCCVNIQIINRINVSTGRLEISIDNGETWRPSPNDPIHNIIEMPPPVPAGISANKCDAATNGLSHVEDWIAHVSNDFDLAVTFIEFAALVAGAILNAVLVFLTGGLATAAEAEIIALIVGAMIAVWNGGKALFVDYWTQENRDIVLCALFCSIGENGSFTETEYQQFFAKAQHDLPAGLAKTLFLGFIQSVGRPGVNNMCSYGEAALADCSGCDCGTCNLANWQLRNVNAGHTRISGVDEIGSYVGATSDDGGNGNFYVILSTQDANTCCFIATFAALPGEFGDGLVTVIPCGNEQIEGNKVNIGSTPSRCVNLCQAQSAQPFTIKFYLGEC